MVIDEKINLTLASQLLIFAGWRQVETEELSVIWFMKGFVQISISRAKDRGHGVNVQRMDPVVYELYGKASWCENIAQFSQVISILNSWIESAAIKELIRASDALDAAIVADIGPFAQGDNHSSNVIRRINALKRDHMPLLSDHKAFLRNAWAIREQLQQTLANLI